MKNVLLIMVLGIFLFALPNTSYAKKSNIDLQVTDQNDCAWRITGWIEYSIFPPKITDYDVWAVDCHGNKYHFVGMIIPGSGGNNLDDYTYTFEQVECPNGCDDNDKYFVFDQLVQFVESSQNE